MARMLYLTNYGKEVLGSFQYYLITYMERMGHKVDLLRPRDGDILRQIKAKGIKPPDFIMLFEGELIEDLNRVRILKEVPKCWWFMDTFKIAEQQKQWILQTEPDICFVRDKREVNTFKDMVGVTKFEWLPPGYDETFFKKLNIEKKYDIGFVGWVKEERARWLNMFAEKGLKVFAQTSAPIEWGWKMNDNFTYNQSERVGYDRFSEIYNMCKIGFHRSFVGDITWRPFEVTGCGSMCLSDRFDAVEDLWIPDKEIVLYDNTVEMVEKAVYYANSPKEREEIALKGYERSIKDHTWKNRIDRIIKALNVK